MPVSYTHTETKERIISLISTKGPSLPVQIARMMNISPLFASAFLSELYGEGKLRISNLRVGSSPLYYVSGQETELEKFIQYLNQKEREAYFLLKEKKILDDEIQQPAIRVALRAIKDFAVSFRDNQKTFWKFFNLPIQEISVAPISPVVSAPKSQLPIASVEVQEKSDKSAELINKKPAKIEGESQFQRQIKEYLTAKNIEILEFISDKKKELIAKVCANTIFGKQEFYLAAKDKKKITETDLNNILQKSDSLNMPAVIISSGEMDKKAKEYHKIWKNMLKFERCSFDKI
ncbi:MAG: hypothetical protein Q8L29_00670 [archaeon]|nr:hypothetical protein [archaeon]